MADEPRMRLAGRDAWSLQRRLKTLICLSGFEKIQELLAHKIVQGLLSPEVLFDATSSMAMLDPDIVQVHDG